MSSRKTRHLLWLETPRWQAKRLEVLAKSGNRCEECGAPPTKDAPLHVHHGTYEGDTLPWDYPDESLHVLCPTCHGTAQALMTRLNRLLGTLTLEEYRHALEYVEGVTGRAGGCLVVSR